VGDTATALRLLRAHLAAASEILDALVPPPDQPAPPDEEPGIACPCGETRDEKLEETSFAGEDGRLIPRVTCLTCGKSFNPKGEEVAIG